MYKSDLKNGDVVETREGKRYIVLIGEFGNYNSIIVGESGFLILDNYKENLKIIDGSIKYDIMKIYKPGRGPGLIIDILINGMCSTKVEKWTWQRKKVRNV